jgi:hypothetical protein
VAEIPAMLKAKRWKKWTRTECLLNLKPRPKVKTIAE